MRKKDPSCYNRRQFSSCNSEVVKKWKTSENMQHQAFPFVWMNLLNVVVWSCRKLTSIAFSDMNPFPGRLLRNRRVLHLEHLQGELRELEEQQREFVTESAVRKDKELDTMVSEDDEELWSHWRVYFLKLYLLTVGRNAAASYLKT